MPRLERRSAVRVEPSRRDVPPGSRLAVAAAGTIDGLTWQQSPVGSPQVGEVRLRVLAAGVNFRDVLMTLGIYPGETRRSGPSASASSKPWVTASRPSRSAIRCSGSRPEATLREVHAPASFLTRLPAGLSIEEAAALPVAFLTAMYGLQEIARYSQDRAC